MQRTCFTLVVEPEHLDDFVATFSGAATELAPSFDGLLAHSLFSDGTGFVAGYLESRDGSRAPKELAGDPLALEWRAELAKIVGRHGAPHLPHPVFQLEQQLGTDVQRGGERACFRLQVDPARVEEYRALHSTVRRDVLDALRASGARNHTLFLGDDGSVVGYLEAADLEDTTAYLSRSQATKTWEGEVAPLVVALDDGYPGQQRRPLTEVFRWER